MIVTVPNAPPRPDRPDENSHPTLDDDILSEDVADSAIERTAADFHADEEQPTPPPVSDEARG